MQREVEKLKKQGVSGDANIHHKEFSSQTLLAENDPLYRYAKLAGILSDESEDERVKSFVHSSAGEAIPFCWGKFEEGARRIMADWQKAEEQAARKEDRENGDSEISAGEQMIKPSLDASCKVWVSPDRMEAYIALYPPLNDGQGVTPGMIDDALEGARVAEGIDEELLQSLCDNPLYLKIIKIAQGTPPVDGKDGEVVPFIILPKTVSPREDEHGRIDFKELNWIVNVEADQKICEIVPPTEEIDGIDVTGKEVRAKKGKQVPEICGKDTAYSADKRYLIAKKDGQLTQTGVRYTVSDVLVIPNNVDYSTGNIKSSGTVLIKGDVCPNFKVEAKHDIVVQGIVDSATLKAGGDICILGGVVASDKGIISANGDVRCKYVEYGHINVGGNAYFENMILSNIVCKGDLFVTSGRGTIIGGKTQVMGDVHVNIFGNLAHCKTYVHITLTEEMLRHKTNILHRIKETDVELTTTAGHIQKLETMAKEGELSPQNKKLLEYLKTSLQLTKIKAKNVQEQLNAVTEAEKRILKRRVKINHAFPNVTISIDNASYKINHEIGCATFRLGEDGVECLMR